MPRPQFSIRTLFWLTLVVAAFFGGMGAQSQLGRPFLLRDRLESHP